MVDRAFGDPTLGDFQKKVMSKTPSQELYTRFSKRNNAAEG